MLQYLIDRKINHILGRVHHPQTNGKIERFYETFQSKIQHFNSLHRMSVNSLDLLQFHWWDYNNPYYMDALRYLSDLRDKGRIKYLGLTNLDTERMQIMVDSKLEIVSNQVQYSIIDRRPEVKMIPFCLKHNIALLAYGCICGGLMSERYLKTKEPTISELNTLSLRKYKKMIDKWGGWSLFQELLLTLNRIAQKYNVNIANVATRYILNFCYSNL